ncbi:MAG: ThuA domain-containing protein [Planctomycetaceae bacterium]|jgi:nicotinamidase-related amidase/type 1 glutamine amidotransferase|nr:ThuA domain-containing protein [Planctomycetaceae bacterium]
MSRRLIALFAVCLFAGIADAEPLQMSVQQRVYSGGDKDALMLVNRIEQWLPNETAVIVCDMWDKHWCKHSTARWVELSKTINLVLDAARKKGVLIVHAPSGCMPFYKDYPQRKALAEYKGKGVKVSAAHLPAETGKTFPINDSDGGCECTPKCKVEYPWKRQSELIAIAEQDVISDSGEEIVAYFQAKGIKNVMMTGVAANMCCIGRSFGLRALKRLGFNAVMVRDLTDVMYNPLMPPKVEHFSGLDLALEYIETYISPSVVSSSITGQKQFRFPDDKRKRIAFIAAEGEYRSNQSLPEFAHQLTLRNYHGDFALGVPKTEGEGRHNIENLQILDDADLMVLYVRRRALEPEKTAKIKRFIESGKPVLGLRTSCVAFDAKKKIVENGKELAQWTELDRDVWGGNYQGYDEQLRKAEAGTDVTIAVGKENHPLLKGVAAFHAADWLYKNTPLRSEKAEVLLRGKNPKQDEPVFWLNGSSVIYTSLGHWDDWKDKNFQTLMFNTVEYLLNEEHKER